MRPELIGLAPFVGLGFAFIACGQDPSTTATSSSSASGAGGAPNCMGVNLVYGDDAGTDPCDICLHKECCAELANCSDEICIKCTISPQSWCSERAWIANQCASDHCYSPCTHPVHHSTAISGAGGATSSSSGK